MKKLSAEHKQKLSDANKVYADGLTDMQRLRSRLTSAAISETNKAYRAKIKAKVFTHYGNACACCGETIEEFLGMDHKDNDGASHRRQGIYGLGFYLWLIRHNFPENFQLLCLNCNIGKYRCNGTCPHKLKDPTS